MARFEFRLKSLLMLRQSARDQCRLALAASQDTLHQLDRQRDALERQLVQQREASRAGAVTATIDPRHLLALHRYQSELRGQLDLLAQRQRQLLAQIERQREELLAADREVRTLEKLRERQWDQFRRDQALAETKTLDEIASHPALSQSQPTQH
jgi:flagellar FliJ protein